MNDDWNTRIDAFWATADDTAPESALTGMWKLVAERPPGDAAATFELASVHDFLDLETDAIPLYREALALGLDGERKSKALIGLASSLRNVGQPDEAITVLETMDDVETVGDAREAFLALALFDAGRKGEALRVALTALGDTLPKYGRAVKDYAGSLPAN